MSARALGILHLAIHDAFFAIQPPSHGHWGTYLKASDPARPEIVLPTRDAAATDVLQAMAGAAVATLTTLYGGPSPGYPDAVSDALDALIASTVAEANPAVDSASPSYVFGGAVAARIVGLLAIKVGEPGAQNLDYDPDPDGLGGRWKFRHDPSNPVKLVPSDPKDPASPKVAKRDSHGPFYGATAKRFAATVTHRLADPPTDGEGGAEAQEYLAALREVVALGGAPLANGTKRSADQTVAALYWAYDGANLIGTPPRLYNQILRVLAWSRRRNGPGDMAEFVRLFALANTAMADAGIFAWQEKYHHNFWRPLTGVREHDPSCGPGPVAGDTAVEPPADPFWLPLGAPSTNTNGVPFKPNFPAYPSGHATFGAAAFQMARRFYRWRGDANFGKREPDRIGFTFVSEELNGKSRDLYAGFDVARPITDQPGLVRTRVVRHFDSLWAAILENGASRVYLGVHWRYDAFAGRDVIERTNPDGTTVYKRPRNVRYTTRGPRQEPEFAGRKFPIGGVPLGLDIADDIFESGMVPSPLSIQPAPPAPPATEGLTVESGTARASGAIQKTPTNIR